MSSIPEARVAERVGVESLTGVRAQGELATAVSMPTRLASLDVFRGLTIAGMILVNNPGTWSAIYPPLQHAEWHGWTPTDLIFPFFIFIVGVAMTFSFANRKARGDTDAQLMVQVFRRSLIIFGLGLFLNGLPFFNLSTIRIPGVLQRIAVCYFFSGLIFLKTRLRGQIIAIGVLLFAYWALMMLVPVPGYGAGALTPEGNLAAYIDSTLLHRHMYRATWDPEGILSTIPAIGTALFGALVGHLLRSERSQQEKFRLLIAGGALAAVVGWVWGLVFPINKNLWTSSYVVFSAGLASIFLAICYWIIDIRGWKRWALPFTIFGLNSILVFVLSGVLGRILVLIKVHAIDGKEMALKTYLFKTLFASVASPINASLLFAICYVLLWLGVMTILYKKRFFLKI